MFRIGDLVEIVRKTRALNQYGQPIGSGEYIDAYSHARVVAYNDRYTENVSDDFIKVKIVSGDDDLKGKEVWIAAKDFQKVDKVY